MADEPDSEDEVTGEYDPVKGGKYDWDADGVEVTPSPTSERYVLACAAASAIESGDDSTVQWALKKGLIDKKFELTEFGERRLRTLMAQTRVQDAQRMILSLASLEGGLIEKGPQVEQLISQGWINAKTLRITNEGQRQLANLTGLELHDSANSAGEKGE